MSHKINDLVYDEFYDKFIATKKITLEEASKLSLDEICDLLNIPYY